MSRARDLGSAFSSSSSLSSDSEVTSAVNAVAVKKGNTASRPQSPVLGDLYSNTQTGFVEVYSGPTFGWEQVGGIASTVTGVTATNTGTSRAYNNGAASISFTPGTILGKTYTIISSPGAYTATGSSSPITITGLQSSTQYTYTVVASNNYGTAAASSASNAVTATTIPQAPDITSVTGGNAQATVAFSANATGGSSITGYTVTSSPGNITASGASSPITVTGLTNGTAYTFTVRATNANGQSAASAASSSVTTIAPYTGESVSGGSGYTNVNTVWTDNTSSLSTTGTPSWTCSNQGSYYGGAAGYSLGGTASFKYTLNNGNPIPAGTYSYSGTQYLFWDSGGSSHDGMDCYAVGTSSKSLIVHSQNPGDPLNTQITKTGTFTVASSQVVYLNWQIYDGSSATSMGGRVYNFTVTKTA